MPHPHFPPNTVLLLLLLLLTATEACKTVRTMLKSQHKRFYLHTRRGAPSGVVKTFFREYAYHLAAYVHTHSPTHPMGAVCLTRDERLAFAATYNKFALEDELAALHDLIPRMFYLPASQYPDSELLPLSNGQQNQVGWMWRTAENQLELPAAQVDVKKLSIVPGGLTFFYDPEGSSVCDKFDRLVPNSAADTNALDVLYDVVALVLRLKLLKVPDPDSLHILRHHTAFTFSGVRCKRVNKRDLPLSRVFFPWYRLAFDKLTASMDLAAVPEIPPSVVEARLKSEIIVLAHYQSWGRLKFFSFDGQHVQQHHISERIFNPQVLDLIRSDIGMEPSGRYQANGTANGEIRMTSELLVVERTETCPNGYFSFESPPDVSTPICCPMLCQCSDVLGDDVLTVTTCCQACNLDSCDGENPLLIELSSITLMPYGFDPGQSIAIML